MRKVGSSTYNLTYDAENRLTGVSGAASATFVYDGDGNRVKATFGSATTVYVGNYYEKEGSTVRKYYYAGGARVAMREGSTLYYILTDHLGSTAITVNSGGTAEVGELRYYPYGGTRYTSGTTPTSRRFTGQVEDATIGLYFYNARYYDLALGRFVQADTIVPEPGNPQDWNRYSYVANNPVRSTDPSGHFIFNRPNWMYFVLGLNAVAYAKDCAVSISQAIDAYNAGERRVGALAMHATGATDALVRQAEAVSQLNTDVDVVFSNASLEERLPHAAHLGVWATGKAAEIVGATQLAQTVTGGIKAASQSTSAEPIDELLYRFSNKKGEFTYGLNPGEEAASLVRAADFESPAQAFETMIGRPPASGDMYRVTNVGTALRNGYYPVYDSLQNGMPYGHTSLYGNEWGRAFQAIFEFFGPARPVVPPGG
jgi:RHS repeat-associated protein